MYAAASAGRALLVADSRVSNSRAGHLGDDLVTRPGPAVGTWSRAPGDAPRSISANPIGDDQSSFMG